MTDFKLNDNWDIEFTSSGDIELIDGAEECTQNSKFRTQTIFGEMFDDTRKGVPWLTDMVSPSLDIDTKKRILERVILSTPNAVKLNFIEVSVDTSGKAFCNYEGITTNGESFEGSI